MKNLDTRLALNIVRGAKHMIEHFGWTQHHLAQNQYGDDVGVYNPDATCFCTVGALQKATIELRNSDNPYAGEYAYAHDILARDAVYEAIYGVKPVGAAGPYIENWNDRPATDKQAVIDMFSKAAKLLEAEIA